jgi:hypothetical protein
LGGAIDDDFGMAHLSDAAEQFGEVGFGDVVRQVSDVEAAGSHFMLHDGARGFGLTRRAGFPCFAWLAWLACFACFAWLARFPRLAGFARLATAVAGLGLGLGWAGGPWGLTGWLGGGWAVGAAQRRFWSEADEGEHFLPECEFRSAFRALEGFGIAVMALAFVLVAAAVVGRTVAVAATAPLAGWSG